jgi:hypothetical protein
MFNSDKKINLKYLFFVIVLPFMFAACSEGGNPPKSNSSSVDLKPAASSMQQGSLPSKVVSLQQDPFKHCGVFFEGTNNSQNTLSMTLNLLFKTPQNQVIESSLRVFTIRGGQTSTVKIGVNENCSEIGSLIITNTTTCQLDGKFVKDDICWNRLSPQSGVIPIVK